MSFVLWSQFPEEVPAKRGIHQILIIGENFVEIMLR